MKTLETLKKGGKNPGKFWYGYLVLEFLALVIFVTVLIVISGKFKPLVIITSAYPNLGLTVTAFGHTAPERTYPFICSGIKVRLAELLPEMNVGWFLMMTWRLE
jgi:hypothetical protein